MPYAISQFSKWSRVLFHAFSADVRCCYFQLKHTEKLIIKPNNERGKEKRIIMYEMAEVRKGTYRT